MTRRNTLAAIERIARLWRLRQAAASSTQLVQIRRTSTVGRAPFFRIATFTNREVGLAAALQDSLNYLALISLAKRL